MGRAYSVREASIKKSGAKKGKLYTTYGKEITKLAKEGGANVDSNIKLKRIIDRAKKDDIPNDIIERALKRGEGSASVDYKEILYEGFGPGASTLIIKCSTDNVNRSVALVRGAFTKMKKQLGVQNSVLHNYDYLGIITVKEDEEEVLNTLINNNIDILDIENNDGLIDLEMEPTYFDKAKDALETINKEVEYIFEEVGYFPKIEINLEGEDMGDFKKLLELLEEIDDVDKIYHNVGNL